jgi:protein-disulfide isomerase
MAELKFPRFAGLLASAAIALIAAGCGNKTEGSVMAGEAPATKVADSKETAAVMAALSKEEQAAVRALVRDTLLTNPEILLEAQEAYTAKMTRQQNDQVVAAYPKLKAEAATLTAGPANAPITIVEFFDYRCPYCHASNEWARNLIANRDDVRFIFKQFPVLSENSVGAAQAAIAANRQGKFLEFHHALMAAQGDLNMTQIMQIAASVGLDTAKLQADMARPEVQAMISEVNQQATTLGISGTPAFVINGQLISGFDTNALDTALSSAGVDGDVPPAGSAPKNKAG